MNPEKNIIIAMSVMAILIFIAVSYGIYFDDSSELTYSDILQEDALVSDVFYSPSKHGSGIGVGPTLDMDGNLGVAVTSVSVNIPEKWGVVFKCQHGKFVIEGTTSKYKNLWNQFEENDNVVVNYKEIYKNVYRRDSFGQDRYLAETYLVDYDFLYATLKR